MKNKVYISGALTGVSNFEDVKTRYELLGQLCIKQGIEGYVPHLHTDPVVHAYISPQQVYRVDSFHVRTSDLIIADVSNPSLGVGQEIEIARYHDIPVILLCERSKPLSRMTRGSPNIIAEIYFDSLEDVLAQVREILMTRQIVMS